MYIFYALNLWPTNSTEYLVREAVKGMQWHTIREEGVHQWLSILKFQGLKKKQIADKILNITLALKCYLKVRNVFFL